MKQSGALPTIFSFFLGLIVTAFVGVGTYTFHPSPEEDISQQLQELSRQEQDIKDSRSPEQLTSADRDLIQALHDERKELNDTSREARTAWGRSTSIILIVFATIVMAISLLRADRLPVISNGLLLGGIFTMLYGVGWIVSTDNSVTRFIVMTVALAITLALGYVRFVRRDIAALPGGGSSLGDGDLGELEQRVRGLEDKMNMVASVFGDKRDR